MSYSAGSIFLQVVPSFRGVPETIRAEAEKWGDTAGQGFSSKFEDQVKKGPAEAINKGGTEAEVVAARAGAKAGDRYAGTFEDAVRVAVARANREVGTIKISADDTEARVILDDVKARLALLRETKIGLEVDAADVYAELAGIEAGLRRLNDENPNIDVRVNAARATLDIARVREDLMRLSAMQIEPEINVDRQLGSFESTFKRAIAGALQDLPPVELNANTTPVDQAIAEIRAELYALNDKKIGIDISAQDAMLKLEELKGRLAALSGDHVEVQARVDALAAMAELDAVKKMVEKVDGSDANIDVNVKGAATAIAELGAVKEAARAARDESDRAGQSVGRTGGLIGLLVGLAPAAAPLAVAGGGALAAAAPLGAAGLAGLGVGYLGLSGIGAAVTAYDNATGPAGQQAQVQLQRSQASAYNSMVNAQQGVGNAQTSAADTARADAQAIVSAEQAVGNAKQAAADQTRTAAETVTAADQAVQSAEEALKQAQVNAATAQRDLTQARVDAARAQRDIALQARGGALALQTDTLNVQDARVTLANVDANPASTAEQKQRAQIALQEALLQLDMVKASNSDIAAKEADFAKTGIEGSAQVVAAKQRIVTANEAIDTSTQAIATAEQRAADARIAQTEGAQKAQQAIVASEQALANARTKQSEDAVKGQQAIETAQRALTQAQLAYHDAMIKSTSQANALADAFQKIGPAGQAFVKFWVDLFLPAFVGLKSIAEAGMLPGLTGFLTAFMQQGPIVKEIVGNISKAIGDIFTYMGQMMGGPVMQSFFQWLASDAPRFIEMIGKGIANLFEGAVAFTEAMTPLADFFGTGLLHMTERFDNWAKGLKGSSGLSDFFAMVKQSAPIVTAFFDALWGAVEALAKVLYPMGLVLLPILTGLLNFIANANPTVLSIIVGSLVTLFAAVKLYDIGNTVFSKLDTVFDSVVAGYRKIFPASIEANAALWTTSGAVDGVAASEDAAAASADGFWASLFGPITIIVAIIAAIGVAFYLAYTHIKPFHDAVNALWGLIVDGGKAVADWFMTYVVPAFQRAWVEIGKVAKVAWDEVIHPVLDALGVVFGQVMDGIGWAWKNIGEPLFKLMGSIISFLWTNVVEPIFAIFAPVVELAFKKLGVAWEAIGRPVFDVIGQVIVFLWNYIIKPLFEAIGIAFEVLVKVLSWFWENVGKPVFTVIMDIAMVLLRILVVVVFGAIKLAWMGLAQAFKDIWDQMLHPVFQLFGEIASALWNEVLKPTFKGIGDAWHALSTLFMDVWDRYFKPVWDNFGTALAGLLSVFGITRDGIKKVWEDLQRIVAIPINFVIDTVFNKGLFAAWNWVVENLGLPHSWHAPHWDTIAGYPDHFAAGGEIPGPYLGPTADNVMGYVPGVGPIRVNPREWIQPVASVDYYGPEFMQAIQHRAIPREALGYAGGGGMTWQELDKIRQQMFPGSVLTSAYRPGANDYHGLGEAIDIGVGGNLQSGLMPIAAALARVFPQSTELIHNPNGSIKNGHQVSPSFWGPATWAEHANHVHWAMTPEALAGGPQLVGPSLLSQAFGSITGYLGDVWNSATDVLGSLEKSIAGPIGRMAGQFGNSPIIQVAEAAPSKLLSGMWGAAKQKVEDFFSNFIPTISDTGSGVASATSGASASVVDAVKSAASPYNWQSGAEWHGIDYILSHESGWNPQVQNPGSSASGLGQFIDSTWRGERPLLASGYAHMKDAPVEYQADAIMRYISQKYNDPIRAMDFWMANNYYSEGGQAPVPTLHDSGGWIYPGLNMILNRTGRPEPTINPQTLDALHSVAANGGHGDNWDIDFHGVNQPREIMDELFHEVTVRKRGGRY